MITFETDADGARSDYLVTLRVAATAATLWGIAALGAHLASTGFSHALLRFAGRLVVIWLCGGLLSRLAGMVSGRATLFIGIAWVTAAIAAELYLSSHGVHGWYELLGSPSTDPDWMRALTAAAWLLSPKLSARD